MFSSLFAVGVIAVTLLTRNAHIGTEAVMGNVDALQLGDAKRRRRLPHPPENLQLKVA